MSGRLGAPVSTVGEEESTYSLPSKLAAIKSLMNDNAEDHCVLLSSLLIGFRPVGLA